MLVRGERGISMTLQTSELPAGHAFTIWWIIFNHPEHCTGGAGPYRCGGSDFGTPEVQATVLRAAGHVIGQSGNGSFAGQLAVGDTREAVFGPGLSNPMGADVLLVALDHGPADPAIIVEQIHSIKGCNPDCIDWQFSVHEHR